MGAPDELLYEYAVIRFVPRVDRQEFINIGLVMMSKRNKWMKALVLYDEERIKALFPGTDLDCLKKQAKLFEKQEVPEANLPVEEKYRWLTAVKSACLQVSPSHPGLLQASPQQTYPASNDGISLPELMEKEFFRLFHSLIL